MRIVPLSPVRPTYFLSLLFATSACDCGSGDGLIRQYGVLEATPNPMAFDTVPVGARSAQRLTLANTGTWGLNIESIALSEDSSSDFSLGADAPDEAFEIMPGQDRAFSVVLRPSTTGDVKGTLIVTSNDQDNPRLEIPLSAVRREGPAMTVCMESADVPLTLECGLPGQIDFGVVRITESRTAQIMVYSSGTIPLTVDSIGLRADSPSAFGLEPRATQETLQPGESKSLRLTFAPPQNMTVRTAIDITSDDPKHSSTTIDLLGRGGEMGLCVEPSAVDFGGVAIGETAERSLTLRNCGNTPFDLLGARYIHDSAEFSLPAPMTQAIPLAPIEGVSFSLKVAYSPVDEGDDATQLAIRTTEGEYRVPVVGRAGGCNLQVLPMQVTFQTDIWGGEPKSVLVENVGSGACVIDKVDMSPETPVDFELFEPFTGPQTLEGGESLTLSVSYFPLDHLSDANGVLRIHSDEPGNPVREVQLVARSGFPQGCSIRAVPSAVQFGGVPVGQRREQGLRLANEGSTTCHFTDVSIVDDADNAFSILLSGQSSLESQMSLLIPVSFAPGSAGAHTATLRLTVDDDDNSEIDIPLSGSSGEQSLCVSPRHLAFGNTQASSTSFVNLVACGSSSVVITDLEWSTSDAEFTLPQAPTLPLTLQPGDQAQVGVQYTPTDAEGDTGILTVVSSDLLNPRIPVRVTGGREIVPASAGSFLYYWQIALDGDVMRMPLQGSLEAEPFWGPSVGKECAGCHNLSPDGRYVGMTLMGDFSGMSTSLSFVDTDTSQLAMTANEVPDATYMSWNPDVNTNPPYQYVYSTNGDLHIASLYTGYIGPLAGAADPNYDETMPAWGPDGTIFFVRGTTSSSAGGLGLSGQSDILVVNEAGGAATRVPGASDNEAANYYPAVSPDGRWLAFTQSVSAARTISAPDSRIWVTAADLSGVVRSLDNANANTASSYPTWARDSSHLSFSSDRAGGEGSWDLYLTPFDTTTGMEQAAFPISEANTSAFEHAAQWSP